MEDQFSPAAQRILRLARALAGQRPDASVGLLDLLQAIAGTGEAASAPLTRSAGIETLFSHPSTDLVTAEESVPATTMSPTARSILVRAQEIAVQYSRFGSPGSEEILIAILESPGELARRFRDIGVEPAELVSAYHRSREPRAIALEPGMEWRAYGPAEWTDTARILDANLNRAREGLRVVEEYARFAIDHQSLTESLKDARHRLKEIASGMKAEALIVARQTEHDVGTELTSEGERARGSLADVATANMSRVQEALRAIEEYAKIEYPAVSAQAKKLRYDLYTIDRRLRVADRAGHGLGRWRLYWLCDPHDLAGGLEWVVAEAIRGGVDVIQLRDKKSTDRERIAIARRLREWTREGAISFIVNDRPDIARLSDADGVHVGQDELTVRDARRIVGPDRWIGVSTHSIEQANQAILDGADYIGVGPVYPSKTKSFATHVGVDLVRQVLSAIEIPAFAIGGIAQENLSALVAVGCRRIAVGQAIGRSDDPRATASALRAALDG